MKKLLSHIWIYLLALLATVFFLILVFRLWRADLSIPFSYSGDALWALTSFKSIKKFGWNLTNYNLGAPGIYQIHDFANANGFLIFLSKITLALFNSYIIGFNFYYLLTFVLTSLTSLFVFEHFKIRNLPALAGSLLFSFASYHLVRGQGHLFLVSYFIVPFIIMVCLWLLEKNKLSKNQWYAGLAVSFLTGSSGVYYAFFSCFFLLISSIYSFYLYQSKSKLKKGLMFIIVAVFSALLNLIPSRIYHLKYGSNSLIGQRSPVESEIYGLRIIQLFIPYSRHGVDWLNNKRIKYVTQNIVSRGEMSEYLGIFGIIGFVFLIAVLFRQRRQKKLTDHLAFLNFWGLMLGVVSGLGTIFAYLVTPSIRAYNRISIFISFFSVFGLVILLDKLTKKLKNWFLKLVYVGFLTAIIFIGIWDQSSGLVPPAYGQISQQFNSDKVFVETIESRLPDKAMIFQLPYKSFPETPPINRVTDYDLFRPFLYSKNLHWSYGAPKGRSVDKWQRTISQQTIENMLRNLAFSGFSGLTIDKAGYLDNGQELEQEISNLLDQKSLISQDQRMSFFDLTTYVHDLQQQFTQVEWQIKRDLVLNPVEIKWGEGFSDPEQNQDMNWRWSGPSSEIILINGTEYEREITLNFQLETGYKDFSQLEIEAPEFEEKIMINSEAKNYSLDFRLPPGEHKIIFTSQAQKVNAPNDPRDMRFRVINFQTDD